MTSSVLAAGTDGPAFNPAHLVIAGLIGLALLALVTLLVVLVGSVVRSDLSAGAKLLWVLFIVWMPVLSWFAWYLLGRPAARRGGFGNAQVSG